MGTQSFSRSETITHCGSKFLRMAEKEEIVITRQGKPAGVLMGFASEDDWFDYQLENDRRFLKRAFPCFAQQSVEIFGLLFIGGLMTITKTLVSGLAFALGQIAASAAAPGSAAPNCPLVTVVPLGRMVPLTLPHQLPETGVELS